MAVCEYCHKEFENPRTRATRHHRPTQRFCSLSCSVRGTTPNICRVVTCGMCKQEFRFMGRGRVKWCPACRRVRQRERTAECKVRLHGMLRGVGSGGNQLGPKNHMWNPDAKHHRGEGYTCEPTYRRKCLRLWEPRCVIKDCLSLGAIDVHHIDGNRENIAPNNLVPVCRTCHVSNLHKRRLRSPKAYRVDFMSKASEECRSKIAELSGNPDFWRTFRSPKQKGESEPKARCNCLARGND